VEAIKRFVETGLGASLLPHSAVQEELTRGTTAAVTLSDIAPLQRTTYLAYLSNRYQTFGMREFIRLLTALRTNNVGE
jgi:DNA-binding transcriptional LysR family regulator